MKVVGDAMRLHYNSQETNRAVGEKTGVSAAVCLVLIAGILVFTSSVSTFSQVPDRPGEGLVEEPSTRPPNYYLSTEERSKLRKLMSKRINSLRKKFQLEDSGKEEKASAEKFEAPAVKSGAPAVKSGAPAVKSGAPAKKPAAPAVKRYGKEEIQYVWERKKLKKAEPLKPPVAAPVVPESMKTAPVPEEAPRRKRDIRTRIRSIWARHKKVPPAKTPKTTELFKSPAAVPPEAKVTGPASPPVTVEKPEPPAAPYVAKKAVVSAEEPSAAPPSAKKPVPGKRDIRARIRAIWAQHKKEPLPATPKKAVVSKPAATPAAVKKQKPPAVKKPLLSKPSPKPPKVSQAVKERAVREKLEDLKDKRFVSQKEIETIRQKSAVAPADEKASRQRVLVKQITFSGHSVVTTGTLKKLVGYQVGKKLSLADLQDLAQRVARHYHEQGYFLTRVAIPQQDFTDGKVEFRVLEGRLGEIIVKGNKRFHEIHIRKAFSALPPGKPIKKQVLERALLILNTSSGIKAKSLLQAGKDLGTTDLVIEVLEQTRAESSVSVNNFGSKTSGRYRISPQITFPNVSGRGDSIMTSVVSAPDTSDLLFGQLNYILPIGSRGSQLRAYVSGGRFEIGREYDILDIKGDGISWGLGISHPQVLSRNRSLTYDAWLEFDDSEHTMLGITTSKDQISKVRLGLNYEKKDSRARNFFSFHVHQGLGENLGGMEDEATLSSRSFALADNQFTKYTFDLTRVQHENSRLFHIARLSGQYSSDPLVSGEQWGIGGANSVRGHLQSTYLGDDGFTVSWETRIALPFENYKRYQLVLFADHGTVKIKKPTTGQEKTQRLSGAGLGFRVKMPDDMDLRFDLGFRVGSSSGKRSVPYVQIMKRF